MVLWVLVGCRSDEHDVGGFAVTLDDDRFTVTSPDGAVLADVSLLAYHLPLDAHLEHGNNALLAAAILVVLAAHPFSEASAINFTRSGPFESCLDTAFNAWTQAQAELMVNEDPRAQSLERVRNA